MKTIKVKISPDGSRTEIKVSGVQGPSCESLVESLEQALGDVVDSGRTEDYYINIGDCVNCKS